MVNKKSRKKARARRAFESRGAEISGNWQV
jgi:hypothetical protein